MNAGQIAMTIPVWFSERVPVEEIRGMLIHTLSGQDRYVIPENSLVYLDGPLRFQKDIEALIQQDFPGVVVSVSEANRGKGAGVAAGLEFGLGLPDVEWFAVRDADGDHRIGDFPAMLDLAEQMTDECPDAPILIVGGRHRLEPPLGLFRATYEDILNRCIGTALQYALAREHSVEQRIYYRQYGNTPDMQSGYKLYNRRAAQMALAEFHNCEAGEFDANRLGAEVVPYASVVLGGGIVGQRMRSTYNEQPTSAYSGIERPTFYARKLAWVLETCGVSAANAAVMLDNELTYVPLIFDDRGREELLAFRELTLRSVSGEHGVPIPAFKPGSTWV